MLLALTLPALSACADSSPAASSPAARPSASAAPSPSASASVSSPAATPSAPPASDPTTSTAEKTEASDRSADTIYCEALRTGTKEINRLTKDKSARSVMEFADAVGKIEAKAPGEVKKDWATFGGLVQQAVAGDVEAIKKGRTQIDALGKRIDKDALKRCGFKVG